MLPIRSLVQSPYGVGSLNVSLVVTMSAVLACGASPSVSSSAEIPASSHSNSIQTEPPQSSEASLMDWPSSNPDYAEACRRRREWTIIVFDNQDVTIDPSGGLRQNWLWHLDASGREIVPESITPASGVSIVALVDTQYTPASVLAFGPNGPSTIDLDQVPGLPHKPDGEVDMGSSAVLGAFGSWAVRRFPSEKVALVVVDHGGGWKGVSWDFDGGSRDYSHIGIADAALSRALRRIRDARDAKIDVLVFEACLMSQWEVAVAIERYVRYLVGSEEMGKPTWGSTHTDFLSRLFANPAMSPRALAESFVESTISSQLTLAVTKLDGIDALSMAMNGFVDAMLASDMSFLTQADSARAGAQGFYGNRPDFKFRDLWGFADNVGRLEGATQAVRDASQRVKDALEQAVVLNEVASPRLAGAHGLSVYLPEPHDLSKDADGPDALYWSEKAPWARVSSWRDLVLKLGEAACFGAASPAGTCAGEVLTKCVDGEVRQQNCAADEMSCVLLDDAGRHACGTHRPCVSITHVGTCGDNVAQHCIGGEDSTEELAVEDCTPSGTVCGFDPIAGHVACVSQQPICQGLASYPCTTDSVFGTLFCCLGDTLVSCNQELNMVMSLPCSAANGGSRCGRIIVDPVSGAQGMSCYEPCHDGDVRCEWDLLESCSGGIWQAVMDCAAGGKICFIDSCADLP